MQKNPTLTRTHFLLSGYWSKPEAEHLQQPGRNAAPAADGYSVTVKSITGALRRWVEANPELKAH